MDPVDMPPKVNKWDGQTVKNTLDDEIRRVLNDRVGWSELHSLMNGRLFISIIAVLFSGVAIVYDYIHPFPKSKWVLATCSLSYFFLMGVLQLYQWYIEQNIFYQAIESDGQSEKRHWKWSSELPAYDDRYTITVQYSKGNKAGKANITKSIANFLTDDGEVVRDRLASEVLGLYNRLVEGKDK